VIVIDPQMFLRLEALATSHPDPEVRAVAVWCCDLVRQVVNQDEQEAGNPNPQPPDPHKPPAQGWWG
jgi:hypothetical protein